MSRFDSGPTGNMFDPARPIRSGQRRSIGSPEVGVGIAVALVVSAAIYFLVASYVDTSQH